MDQENVKIDGYKYSNNLVQNNANLAIFPANVGVGGVGMGVGGGMGMGFGGGGVGGEVFKLVKVRKNVSPVESGGGGVVGVGGVRGGGVNVTCFDSGVVGSNSNVGPVCAEEKKMSGRTDPCPSRENISTQGIVTEQKTDQKSKFADPSLGSLPALPSQSPPPPTNQHRTDAANVKSFLDKLDVRNSLPRFPEKHPLPSDQ
jgi:hypothetical protein